MVPFLLLPPRTKFFLTVILTLFILSGLGFLAHESVGNYVWKVFKNDAVALAIAGDDSDLKIAIAKYYFNGGDYDLTKSLGYFEELYEKGLESPELRYQLARIYFVQGRQYRAEQLLKENLEKYPEWEQARYVLGLTYIYQEKFADAVEQFEKFLAFRNDNWASYNDLAWAYIKNKQYEKAAEIALEGLSKWQGNVWLHNIAGVAYWNTGDLKQAEQHFAEAKRGVEIMSVDEWGKAYPGNDPQTYAASLETMREAVAKNLEAVRKEISF